MASPKQLERALHNRNEFIIGQTKELVQLREYVGALLGIIDGYKESGLIVPASLEVVELIRKRWMAAGGEPK